MHTLISVVDNDTIVANIMARYNEASGETDLVTLSGEDYPRLDIAREILKFVPDLVVYYRAVRVVMDSRQLIVYVSDREPSYRSLLRASVSEMKASIRNTGG